MDTIVFYNFYSNVELVPKILNLAEYYTQHGYKVCLLDFSLTCPRLFYYDFDMQSKINLGMVDYITTFTEEEGVPNLEDYIVKIKEGLTLIPVGNTQASYFKKCQSLNWHKLFYCDIKDDWHCGVAFFLNFKSQIKHELKSDILLILSASGATQEADTCLTLLADTIMFYRSNFSDDKIIKDIEDRIIQGCEDKDLYNFKLRDVPIKIIIGDE
jgi:hypothetical protein